MIKKSVSPIVASLLLLTITIVVGVLVNNWYSDYSQQFAKDVYEKGETKEVRLEFLSKDELYAYNGYDTMNIEKLAIDGQTCSLTDSNSFSKGTIRIEFLEDCSDNLTSTINEVLMVTDRGTFKTLLSVSNADYTYVSTGTTFCEEEDKYVSSNPDYSSIVFSQPKIYNYNYEDLKSIESISNGEKTHTLRVQCIDQNINEISYDYSLQCFDDYFHNTVADTCDLIVSSCDPQSGTYNNLYDWSLTSSINQGEEETYSGQTSELPTGVNSYEIGLTCNSNLGLDVNLNSLTCKTGYLKSNENCIVNYCPQNNNILVNTITGSKSFTHSQLFFNENEGNKYETNSITENIENGQIYHEATFSCDYPTNSPPNNVEIKYNYYDICSDSTKYSFNTNTNKCEQTFCNSGTYQYTGTIDSSQSINFNHGEILNLNRQSLTGTYFTNGGSVKVDITLQCDNTVVSNFQSSEVLTCDSTYTKSGNNCVKNTCDPQSGTYNNLYDWSLTSSINQGEEETYSGQTSELPTGVNSYEIGLTCNSNLGLDVNLNSLTCKTGYLKSNENCIVNYCPQNNNILVNTITGSKSFTHSQLFFNENEGNKYETNSITENIENGQIYHEATFSCDYPTNSPPNNVEIKYNYYDICSDSTKYSFNTNTNKCEQTFCNSGTYQYTGTIDSSQSINFNHGEILNLNRQSLTGTYFTNGGSVKVDITLQCDNTVVSNFQSSEVLTCDSTYTKSGNNCVKNTCDPQSGTYNNLYDWSLTSSINQGEEETYSGQTSELPTGVSSYEIGLTCKSDLTIEPNLNSLTCKTGYEKVGESCNLITSCISDYYEYNSEFFYYPDLDDEETYISIRTITDIYTNINIIRELDLLCKERIVSHTNYQETLECRYDDHEMYYFTGFLETQKITASDGGSYDKFGGSASISEDKIVVGAIHDDDKGSYSGSAYIFEKNQNGIWEEVQKITASDGASNDYFGYSASISEDKIVVGAFGDDDKGSDSGSAYIFEKNQNGIWEEVQKITASDGRSYDYFGYSVSISENTIIVGAYRDGSAYIFEKNQNGIWEEVQKITASDGGSYDYFGYSASISEDVIVVGAIHDDDKGSNSGSAYIFEKNQNGIWEEVQKITASDGGSYDYFGYSASISEDVIVVGAIHDDDKGSNSGSAYIFEKNQNGIWEEVQKITASDGASNDYFGYSASISEDKIVVGAFGDDDKGSDSGSAYIFEKNQNGIWEEVQKIRTNDGASGDYFGYSVSISEDVIVVGAIDDDDKGSDSGSAYIFEIGEVEACGLISCSAGDYNYNGISFSHSSLNNLETKTLEEDESISNGIIKHSIDVVCQNSIVSSDSSTYKKETICDEGFEANGDSCDYTEYEISEDELILIDYNLGLDWQRTNFPSYMNWTDAVSYCENLDYAGYDKDWRLPEKTELESLIDRSVSSSPYIIGQYEYFPEIITSSYWTNTLYSSSIAYRVGFFSGYSYDRDTSYSLYVLCVRNSN